LFNVEGSSLIMVSLNAEWFPALKVKLSFIYLLR